MAKILKKHSIVIDDTKKFTIPVSGMPKEEIIIPEPEPETAAEMEWKPEQWQEPEQNPESVLDFKPDENENEQNSAATPETAVEVIEEEKEPEIPRREYDFEDFDFDEQDDITEEQENTEEIRLRELELEAEQMLEAARMRSDVLIAQAAETAQLIITHTLDNAKMELSNAMAAGYSDGLEAGRNEALKIVEPALNKINILIETIDRLQDKMLYEFRDSMFNIISEISTKIVHKEVNENNHYLVGLFSDAIQNVKAEEFVTITVAESELTIATRNEKLFLAEIPHIKDFKILPDKSAVKGTMIVETEKAVVDASIDVQLEKVNYFLEQMKENLDIPKTVDDVINQVSMKSIENQTDLMSGDEYGYETADYGYDGDVENLNSNSGEEDEINNNANNRGGNKKKPNAVENKQNFNDINDNDTEDISDEEIMKYFNSPDFNVD